LSNGAGRREKGSAVSVRKGEQRDESFLLGKKERTLSLGRREAKKGGDAQGFPPSGENKGAIFAGGVRKKKKR